MSVRAIRDVIVKTMIAADQELVSQVRQAERATGRTGAVLAVAGLLGLGGPP